MACHPSLLWVMGHGPLSENDQASKQASKHSTAQHQAQGARHIHTIQPPKSWEAYGHALGSVINVVAAHPVVQARVRECLEALVWAVTAVQWSQDPPRAHCQLAC